MPNWRFPGGLRLPANKQAAAHPIVRCPVPAEICVPLLQHAGSEGVPCVELGQSVNAGQVLSQSDETRFVPVHAPCAGRVKAIEQRPLAHPSRILGWHVVIDTVRESIHGERQREALAELDIDQALGLIRNAGVAGLGGAVFPTHEKLAHSRDWLIINGAECEPYIACDDRLIRERADQLVKDVRTVRQLLGAARCCIAVEQPMTEAIAALTSALGSSTDLEIAVVDSRYPQGGERQLIQTITGIEVPLGKLPRDVGVMVMNVATVIAVGDALGGLPLTQRLVSVSGNGVRTPGVFEVAIGTSIADLIAAAGGYRDSAKRLVMGGPMMGLALDNDGYPVTKACNSILVLDDSELAGTNRAMPCIRCGDCADVCPAGLLPQQLFHFSRSDQAPRLEAHGIHACIECACCDWVCPSQLPLSAEFRFAKQDLAIKQAERRAADVAKLHHEQRQARLTREAEARARKLEEKRRQVSGTSSLQSLVAKARAQTQKHGDES